MGSKLIYETKEEGSPSIEEMAEKMAEGVAVWVMWGLVAAFVFGIFVGAAVAIHY